MLGLFVDDERNPQDVFWIEYPKDIEWFIVRDYESFVAAYSGIVFDIISFDHDLGLDKSGYDCAKYVTDVESGNPLEFDFVVHSQNPIGKKNIEGLLNGYNRFFELTKDAE